MALKTSPRRMNATGRNTGRAFVKVPHKLVLGQGASRFQKLNGDAFGLLLMMLLINHQAEVFDKSCRYLAKAMELHTATVARHQQTLIDECAVRDLDGPKRRARTARRLAIANDFRLGRNAKRPMYVAVYGDELRSAAWRGLPGDAKKALVVLRFRALEARADPIGGAADVAISSGDLADAVGCSARSAARALRALVQAGFIDEVRPPAWGALTRPGIYRVPMERPLPKSANEDWNGPVKNATRLSQTCDARDGMLH